MCLLPGVILLGGLGVAVMVDQLAFGGTPLFPQAGRLIGLASFVGSSALYALRWWRYKRWELGRVEGCTRCGGPLGGVRMGRRYRGNLLSDFRWCWNCEKPNPVE